MREHIPSKEQFSRSISMCMSTLELHLGEGKKMQGCSCYNWSNYVYMQSMVKRENVIPRSKK